MPVPLPPALRSLAQRPAFTLAALAIVALGTTAASIVDALVFRPIPVDGIEQLYRVQSGVYDGISSPPDARDVFERADAPAFSYTHRFSVEFTQEKHSGLIVLCELQGKAFETLGWQAAQGRLLQSEDYLEGSEPAAVLSHAFWLTELAARPDIVGQTLLMNGKPFRIVGVLPPERNRVSRTIKPHAWTALIHTFEDWIPNNRNSHSQTILARLAPPRTLAAYQTQLDQTTAYLKQAYPNFAGNLPARAVLAANPKDALADI